MLYLPSTMGSGDRPVLKLMPAAVDGREVQLVRGDASDVFNGATNVDLEESIQNVQRTFHFICSNRAEIQELRDFFRARKGRYQSFFYPTWRWEFTLRGYSMPNAGSWFMWLTHSRLKTALTRNTALRWFVISRTTGYRAHQITGGGGDDVTENVALNVDMVHMSDKGSLAPAPITFAEIAPPNETYRVHWMRYGRFDTDKLELAFEGDDMATVDIPLVETPDEVPSA